MLGVSFSYALNDIVKRVLCSPTRVMALKLAQVGNVPHVVSDTVGGINGVVGIVRPGNFIYFLYSLYNRSRVASAPPLHYKPLLGEGFDERAKTFQLNRSRQCCREPVFLCNL